MALSQVETAKKHAEELKEIHRQLRLAESPNLGGVGAISARLHSASRREGAASSSVDLDELVVTC